MSSKKKPTLRTIRKRRFYGSLRFWIKPYANDSFDYFKLVIDDKEENKTIEEECETIEEVCLFLKHFALNFMSGVHDRRIAAWIYDFLQKIGSEREYNEILELVSGKQYIEYDLKKKAEVAEKTISRDLHAPLDVKQRTIAITIHKSTNELRSLNNITYEFIRPEKHIIQRIQSYSSKGKIYENSDGMSPKCLRIPGTFELKTELTNNSNDKWENIEIIDSIPFNYKITNMTITPEAKQSQTSSEDTLIVSVKLKLLNPGKTLKIHYELTKRIQRIIIMKKGDSADLIQKYGDFGQESTEEQVIASLRYQCLADLDRVMITDILPPEFLLNSIQTDPELIPFKLKQRKDNRTQITFLLDSPPLKDILVTNYSLKPLLDIVITKKEVPLKGDSGKLLIGKFFETITAEGKENFGILTYLLYFFADEHEGTEEITLEESYSSPFEIKEVKIGRLSFSEYLKYETKQEKSGMKLKLSYWGETQGRKVISLCIKGKDTLKSTGHFALSIGNKKDRLLKEKFEKRELTWLILPPEHLQLRRQLNIEKAKKVT